MSLYNKYFFDLFNYRTSDKRFESMECAGIAMYFNLIILDFLGLSDGLI